MPRERTAAWTCPAALLQQGAAKGGSLRTPAPVRAPPGSPGETSLQEWARDGLVAVGWMPARNRLVRVVARPSADPTRRRSPPARTPTSRPRSDQRLRRGRRSAQSARTRPVAQAWLPPRRLLCARSPPPSTRSGWPLHRARCPASRPRKNKDVQATGARSPASPGGVPANGVPSRWPSRRPAARAAPRSASAGADGS